MYVSRSSLKTEECWNHSWLLILSFSSVANSTILKYNVVTCDTCPCAQSATKATINAMASICRGAFGNLKKIMQSRQSLHETYALLSIWQPRPMYFCIWRRDSACAYQISWGFASFKIQFFEKKKCLCVTEPGGSPLWKKLFFLAIALSIIQNELDSAFPWVFFATKPLPIRQILRDLLTVVYLTGEYYNTSIHTSTHPILILVS